MLNKLLLCLILHSYIIQPICLIIPEDVPTGFAAIFGFTPRLIKGNDHRFGFGFGFGNHADFQILYEFGPQINTKPVKPPKVRSAYSSRLVRRRPIIEFLLQSGILKKSYKNYVSPDNDLEPR